jgi:hypothetical protein
VGHTFGPKSLDRSSRPRICSYAAATSLRGARPDACNHSVIRMIVRLLALTLVLGTSVSAARSNAAQDRAAAKGTIAAESAAMAAFAPPGPLGGVPLTGPTGLRLLIANIPPLLLDVDSGRITRISGLDLGSAPVLGVRPVGKDAIVWLDQAVRQRVPRAEIYVIRHGRTGASRLATAWEVAPAADGAAVWLKSYKDARHCTLREVALDGRQRRSPRSVPCSTRLVDAGGGALLVRGRSVIDPKSGRTLLRGGRVWAMAGNFVLTVAGSQGPLTLSDLRTGEHRRFRYPSQIGGQGGTDESAVQRKGRFVALSFSDPAYEFSGTQVTDVWLLDTTNRRLRHLPDMPAAVSLKFTSMSWSSNGRLVILAETDHQQRKVVAIWRPGQKRIGVRSVPLPARNGGSDSFVVWQ